jgi:hypothetical protein
MAADTGVVGVGWNGDNKHVISGLWSENDTRPVPSPGTGLRRADGSSPQPSANIERALFLGDVDLLDALTRRLTQ